ncbi:MAG: methyltransferase domain-containing protein [Elusimicrobiales bacterium]
MSACPVCCGESKGPALTGLLICRDCGLAFAAENHPVQPAYVPGLEREIYGSAKTKLFEAALDWLALALPGQGRLLDVGCAGGGLLRAADARGWRGEGVEIDGRLADLASAGGFPVHRHPLEDCGLDAVAYAAVTAFEVFSQMAAPYAAAAEMFRLLEPGGAVYIREFNAGFHLPLLRLQRGRLFKALGLKPAVLHDLNFTPRSLRVLLERAGFREIRIRNSRPTAGDPYRSGGRLGVFSTGLLKFLYYTLAQALWLLSFGRVYAGSSLIITARK